MNNKPISTFHQLIEEQRQLEAKLAVKKAAVKQSIKSIEKQLSPVTRTLGFFNNSSTQKKAATTAVGKGAKLVLDIVLNKYLFAKSGMLVTLLGNSVLKNLTPSLVEEKGKGFFKKWFSRPPEKSSFTKSPPSQ